nr:hypothetical protein [Tanacetum cinerariifolium]
MDDEAHKREETFDWGTATYGKIHCDDTDIFKDFEADFSAIVCNYALTSNLEFSSEPI